MTCDFLVLYNIHQTRVLSTTYSSIFQCLNVCVFAVVATPKKVYTFVMPGNKQSKQQQKKVAMVILCLERVCIKLHIQK